MASITLTRHVALFLGPENPAFHFDEDSRERSPRAFKTTRPRLQEEFDRDARVGLGELTDKSFFVYTAFHLIHYNNGNVD